MTTAKWMVGMLGLQVAVNLFQVDWQGIAMSLVGLSGWLGVLVCERQHGGIHLG